jgi:DNA-binding XRE family transcriptional regulator
MSPAGFKAFRERMGWSRSQCAENLQLDRKTHRRMEEGLSSIPRHIALACAALAHGLPPME